MKLAEAIQAVWEEIQTEQNEMTPDQARTASRFIDRELVAFYNALPGGFNGNTVDSIRFGMRVQRKMDTPEQRTSVVWGEPLPPRCQCFMSPGPPWYAAQCRLEPNHAGEHDCGTPEEARIAFELSTRSLRARAKAAMREVVQQQ